MRLHNRRSQAALLIALALSAWQSEAACTFDPLPNAGTTDLRIDCIADAASTATSAQDVTTVPLPTAVWLLGSGLIGLAGVARRRGSS